MSRIFREKKVFALFASVIFISVLLIFPSYCVQGISNGLVCASEIIIPSLFPYIVLSCFIMRSGADSIIGILFSKPMNRLFSVPQICAACIILSFIGGFPVGAKCVSVLYSQKKITTEQARQMMYFCVCPGPAFMISAVGTVMLGNRNAGVIIYISQIISGMIIGIITGYANNRKTAEYKTEKVCLSYKDNSGITSHILASVSDAADSVIGMTALILLFSMMENVIRNTGLYDLLGSLVSFSGADERFARIILPVLLEVTGGCNAVKEASLPLWCFALCTGFGGLCVHMQIFHICSDIHLKYGRYLLFRVINAMLSAVITFFICRVFSPAVQVFAAGGGDTAHISSATAAGSISLIVLSVIFVLTMHRGRFSAGTDIFQTIKNCLFRK